MEIIDSDGHIFERDEEIRPYLDPNYPEDRYRNYYLFPTLDGWRRGASSEDFDAARWLKFLDDSGISEAVIYPTTALGFGFSRDATWAVELARGYNDFVHDRYLKVSSRLKAVALVAVQDPPAAARELRRAVKELGMVGGMLPAVGLKRLYGDGAFDVLYEEAQSLGTMLAVHGAPRNDIGLDHLDDPDQGFILAHPFSQMLQFTNMVSERVFERFPRLKVAFLEAGCGWVPYLMERIDRRSELRMGRHLASEQVRDHPIYFHAELEEKEVLTTALSVVGEDRFIYASDYPHETTESVSHALETFLARKDLSQATKQKILCDNIKSLYGMNS